MSAPVVLCMDGWNLPQPTNFYHAACHQSLINFYYMNYPARCLNSKSSDGSKLTVTLSPHDAIPIDSTDTPNRARQKQNNFPGGSRV